MIYEWVWQTEKMGSGKAWAIDISNEDFVLVALWDKKNKHVFVSREKDIGFFNMLKNNPDMKEGKIDDEAMSFIIKGVFESL